MTKKHYLRYFSWAVRWQLPPEEAEESISDYQELVEGSEETQLVQTLGKPFQAARLLRSDRDYRWWLAAFGVLLACTMLPALWLLGAERLEPLIRTGWTFWGLFAGAVLLSLFWFRRERVKGARSPKGLFPVLLLLLTAGIAAAGWITFWIICYALELPISKSILLVPNIAPASIFALRVVGTVSALAAIFGLVKSRVEDRRWLALYLMGFSVLFLCVSVYAVLTSMDITPDSRSWLWRWCIQNALLVLGGLLGAGFALC